MILLDKLNGKRGTAEMSLIHCNLRVLMAERGLNIQKVKDQTTLSRTTISNLYNNLGSGIQFGTLLELCELLKCKPGDLLSYIEIVPNFEVMTEKPEFLVEKDTHIVDDDGNGHEYISSIKTDLKFYCLLKYEGFTCDFIFNVEVRYGIDNEKNINNLDVGISPDFDYTLSNLKMPPHVEGYVNDKLDDFLLDWVSSYFYEEIDGATNMFIDHHTLLK